MLHMTYYIIFLQILLSYQNEVLEVVISSRLSRPYMASFLKVRRIFAFLHLMTLRTIAPLRLVPWPLPGVCFVAMGILGSDLSFFFSVSKMGHVAQGIQKVLVTQVDGRSYVYFSLCCICHGLMIVSFGKVEGVKVTKSESIGRGDPNQNYL